MQHGSAAIILAAGGSRRMGSPKALLEVDGAPLIAHHIVGLQAAGLSVRVVIGAEASRIRPVVEARGAAVTYNPAWRTTDMMDSLHLAATQSQSAELVITPVDAAPAPASVLRALLAQKGDAVVSHAGTDGHPVKVSRRALLQLRRPSTLRYMLSEAVRVPVHWPGATTNLNTPEAFAAWQRDATGRPE